MDETSNVKELKGLIRNVLIMLMGIIILLLSIEAFEGNETCKLIDIGLISISFAFLFIRLCSDVHKIAKYITKK